MATEGNDLERGSSGNSSGGDSSTLTEPHVDGDSAGVHKETCANDEYRSRNERGFRPTQNQPQDSQISRQLSRQNSVLSRTRSLNGYGVDDLDVDEGPGAEGERAEKELFEVTWDGGDSDPRNPRSLRTIRKWLIVLVACSGALCVTCGSSIYTSTYTQMDTEFHTSKLVATLGLSTFVLGLASGPLWSPMSEFYGRRPIYLFSFIMFTIWLVPGAVARNIQTMIIARFFQGFFGSAFLSVSGGTVSDLFNPNEMAAPMTIFTLSPFIGPSVGPLVGGFINSYSNWRWVHYVMIIWAFVEFVALLLLVPETYHPVCLRNKARKVRKDTGDERWYAPMEKIHRSLARNIGTALVRPVQLLVFEPMLLCLNLFCAILLGVLYLFFGAIPLVFETHHGFKLWQSGLSFLGIFIGMILGALLNPVWKGMRLRMIARRAAATGVEGASEPEFRLPPTIAGAFFCPAGLFMFGWTSFPSVPWILPIIGSALLGAGILLVFAGIFTFLVDAYPKYAASALASNAMVRCVFAAAFPLFGIQMYDNLGYPWASSLLGFLTVSMLPFPILFLKFGKRIRARSRYATATD